MMKDSQSKQKYSLHRIYSFLYYKFGNREFDYGDILKHIQIDRSAPSRLTNNGYIISNVDVIDYRKKRYRLVSPKNEAFASGFLTELKNKFNIVKIEDMSIETLYHKVLRNLKDKLKYLISGIHAFNYYIPTIIGRGYQLKIHEEDLEKFHSLFAKIKLFPIIFINNKLVNQKVLKPYPNTSNVMLDCSLTEKMFNNARILDGISTISPEFLILDFLKGGGDVYYVLSLILTQDIDFQLLVKLAEDNTVLGKVLFLIQTLEKVLNRKYFFHNEIVEMQPEKVVTFADFSDKSDIDSANFIDKLNDVQIQAIQADETYFSELGAKWGLISILKKSEVNKVIEDINKESWSKFWR